VAQCRYLTNINKDFVDDAIQELARKKPGIVDLLNAKVGVTKKRTHEDISITSSSQGPENTPPLKCSKTEPILHGAIGDKESEPNQVICPGSQNFAQVYQTEGKKELKEKADCALVEFIICCGVPPHILQKKHFQHFVNTALDAIFLYHIVWPRRQVTKKHINGCYYICTHVTAQTAK
jgi:hypothetical protein